MGIRIECTCGKSFRVSPDLAGKKIQCNQCKAIRTVPFSEDSPTDSPPVSEDAAVHVEQSPRNNRNAKQYENIGKAIGGLIVLLVAGIWFFGSRTSPSGRIETVLKADAQYSRQLDADNDVGRYVVRLRSIDTSKCPWPFQQAFEQHVRAWEGLFRQLQSEPQSFGESVVNGFLHGLSGDYTGGVGDMMEARQMHMANIQLTYDEVRRIAAQHGARTNF